MLPAFIEIVEWYRYSCGGRLPGCQPLAEPMTAQPFGNYGMALADSPPPKTAKAGIKKRIKSSDRVSLLKRLGVLARLMFNTGIAP